MSAPDPVKRTPASNSTSTADNGAFLAAASVMPSGARSTTDAPLIQVQPVRHGELQPSYAQHLGVREDDAGDGIYGAFINTLGNCIGVLGAIPCCFICPNPYKPVSQGNVGLVTKFGRFYRAVDPGLVKINPLSERLIHIDVKIQLCEVPQQVCMTKDNVTVHLTSVIYYHITSPHKAAFGISDVRQALIEVRSKLFARSAVQMLTVYGRERKPRCAMSLEPAFFKTSSSAVKRWPRAFARSSATSPRAGV